MAFNLAYFAQYWCSINIKLSHRLKSSGYYRNSCKIVLSGVSGLLCGIICQLMCCYVLHIMNMLYNV